MLEAHLVQETEIQEPGSRGRPAVGLVVETEAWHYLSLRISRGEIFLALRDAHGGAPENFAFYLVAPNGGELDGVQNVDAADYPTHTRMQVDRFNYATRSGRGGDIVAYTLDFHLSACE